ncbi:MAG TPA: hypothetical protein VF575_03035 [Candidatus Saccharimonadales bacterium]|jgi:hypothetical protein
MIKPKQILAAFLLSTLTALSYTPTVMASQAKSSNYGVSEVQFGSGGVLRACSTSYCAKQSAGELTVGNTSSTNYQAQGGFNTQREPFLEVSVSGAVVNLGDLTPETTGKGSTTFAVKSYLASGYNVYIDGTTPRSVGGHALTPMSTAAASQVGIEQFGINLRLNTSPAVGADVAQIPSGTFSFGAPSAGYSAVNNFKYVPGDLIAASNKSSGQTDYTMSMIANIGTTTEAGAYGGRLIINVVPTF